MKNYLEKKKLKRMNIKYSKKKIMIRKKKGIKGKKLKMLIQRKKLKKKKMKK